MDNTNLAAMLDLLLGDVGKQTGYEFIELSGVLVRPMGETGYTTDEFKSVSECLDKTLTGNISWDLDAAKFAIALRDARELFELRRDFRVRLVVFIDPLFCIYVFLSLRKLLYGNELDDSFRWITHAGGLYHGTV